jgi:hypothetical protein
MLSKDDIKTLRIYHKGFKAAEAAHGKDEAMKWHAINAACKVVSGQDKLHNIPANQDRQLHPLVEPSRWIRGLAERHEQSWR